MFPAINVSFHGKIGTETASKPALNDRNSAELDAERGQNPTAFYDAKCRIRGSQLDELRPQKHVQIREFCPKFCILNRPKSVENGLLQCLIGAINRHFSTPKWPDLPCFLAKGVSKILRRQNFGSGHGGPGKKRRLRRSFPPPPAGKLFSVTKSISRNGKHSLLSPETYNVPGTQKRVEYHAPFPLVRRPI